MQHPVGHPHCLFDFDEEKFMDTYVQLFFTTPTIEEYVYGNLLFMAVKIIAFELQMVNHKKNAQGRLSNFLRKGS